MIISVAKLVTSRQNLSGVASFYSHSVDLSQLLKFTHNMNFLRMPIRSHYPFSNTLSFENLEEYCEPCLPLHAYCFLEAQYPSTGKFRDEVQLTPPTNKWRNWDREVTWPAQCPTAKACQHNLSCQSRKVVYIKYVRLFKMYNYTSIKWLKNKQIVILTPSSNFLGLLELPHEPKLSLSWDLCLACIHRALECAKLEGQAVGRPKHASMMLIWQKWRGV